MRRAGSGEAHAGRRAPGQTGGRFGVYALIVLLLAPAGAAAQFAVHPVLVDLDATSRVGTETVTVENQGGDPLEVVVYLSDYERTAEGDHVYVAFGEHENTCAGRLEAFPDQLSLAPGERGEIRLRLQPGSGTCWGMVFVEKRTRAPSGIMVAQRIGVKVLTESPGLAREGRVLGMAVDTTAEPAALVAFANEGGGSLNVRGEVEVRDLAGEIVGVVAVEPFQVLPGRQRRVRVPLDGVTLEPGRYILVAILDFGADYLAGGQAMLEVRP
jgi:hypothetical protein